MVRIIGIRWQSLAAILAAIYAVMGVIMFFYFEVGNDQSFTVPVGFLMPLLNFSVNLHFPRMEQITFEVLLCLGSLIGYAVSGWITGAVAGLVFNFTAPRFGGIDAKWLLTKEPNSQEDPPQQSLEDRTAKHSEE